MSNELAGFGTGWLPPAVQRRIEIEEAQERAEAKRAEAERADLADQAHDRALMAYRAAAEGRGEVVSAIALATGQVAGRTLDEVFAGVIAAADREDGRLNALERRTRTDWDYLDAPEPVLAGRSASWPESEYELDRMLRRADELHRDLVAARARHSYPAAEEAARAKSGRTYLPMIFQ